MHTNYTFNVKPSKPDHRDRVYSLRNIDLKQEVDLRQFDSLVESQGNLGSCVGNAVTNCYELMVKQQQPELFTDLSRLFVYYNARAIEGNVDTDYGVVYIRNALKGIKQYGICTEEIWPYDISKFAIRPTDVAYDDGVKRKISGYTSIPSIAEMLEVLNNESPIIIGMDIFENFLSVNKANPVVAKPDTTDFDIGGHAVAVIGYSIPKQQFLIKNSFGDDWGDAGYGWLTFEYVKDYAFDKWFFTV